MTTVCLGEALYIIAIYLICLLQDRPSPADLRKTWAKSNNGSHALEPHMRQTQIIFEATLKQLIRKEPLIKGFWGYSFESLIESDDSVLSTTLDPSGNYIAIKSRYVIGCDGAGSKVRSNAGILSPRHSLLVQGYFAISTRSSPPVYLD